MITGRVASLIVIDDPLGPFALRPQIEGQVQAPNIEVGFTVTIGIKTTIWLVVAIDQDDAWLRRVGRLTENRFEKLSHLRPYSYDEEDFQ